jgi:hypothetical protein
MFLDLLSAVKVETAALEEQAELVVMVVLAAQAEAEAAAAEDTSQQVRV